MITLNEIREDLKDIRYYYSRKEIFDSVAKEVGTNDIQDKLKKYNEAVRAASPKLFDLYVCLYIRNNTQEAVSEELCYTPEYIQMLNKKLLKFFQEKFSA